MRTLANRTDANAAVEMALVMPILLLLIFGAAETGNYFASEHVLVKGVRDGARYAARQPLSNYSTCATVDPAVVTNTKSVVRTGALSGGTDRLPNWADASVEFDVTVECKTAVAGTTMGGLYTGATTSSGAVLGAPVVTVRARVPYRSILGYAGIGLNLNLNAAQQAAVMGT